MNNYDHHFPYKEVSVAFLLIVLLLIVLNPGKFWMPSMIEMTASVAVLVLFCVFSVFIWKERARDEREQHHRLLASRFAFVIGASVLVLALVIQSIQHTVDPWIAIALGAMVLSKSIGSIWANKRQ